MSHHYSGPDFGFPHGDARLDFTDLYAFPKPGATGKSILVMNVHPSASVNPPGPTTAEPFAPEALYELRIDINGDAVADIAYRLRFSSSEGGAQTATLRRIEGPQAAATDDGGQTIVAQAPVSMDRESQVTEAGDYRFFAGWRSDSLLLRQAGRREQPAVHWRRFFRRPRCMQHRAGSAQLCSGSQGAWPVAPHSAPGGWSGRELVPGGARRAAPATLPCPRSFRRGESCLPRRRADERCRLRRRLRARAGALLLTVRFVNWGSLGLLRFQAGF
jgi:hypothetical protein